MDYDIESVWIMRPVDEDAITTAMRNGVRAVNTSLNPAMWAIKTTDRFCFSKSVGRFFLEPSPSERDEAFYQDCRWTTLDEALAFAAPFIERWKAEEQRRLAKAGSHE